MFLTSIQKANIKLYNSKNGEERNRIMSKVFNLDQQLKAKPRFMDNHGWSIILNYKSSNFKVKVYYQHESSDWITYKTSRVGKYNYLFIHGNKKFGNNSRNLLPGKYNIRIKFFNDYAESDYISVSTVVPEYIDG